MVEVTIGGKNHLSVSRSFSGENGVFFGHSLYGKRIPKQDLIDTL